MSRFFVPLIPPPGEEAAILSLDEIRHASRVLRLRPGDRTALIDGKGTLARGEIVRVADRQIAIRILERTTLPRRDKGRVTLACAIPKKAKFEMILEKCTELGADEIIPMITERTEVRPRRGGTKDERFQNVIVNASKQCKRTFFPVLHPVMPLEDVLKNFILPGTAVFLPWLEGDRVPLKTALSQALAGGCMNFLVLIGPEGDFTLTEVLLARERGAMAVTLGETTLKVDTAACAVVAGIRLFL